MILVMGATGHIGSKIISCLLAQGQEVRGVARHFPRGDMFKEIERAEGDANSVSFMTEAMLGCDAVFTMIPPNPSAKEVRFYQNKIGEVIAEAIEVAGIRKVVNLSSVGADLESGTGPVLGLHDQEMRLNEITHADIVHLRPTYFMENLLTAIPTIISRGRLFGTMPGANSLGMVATKDIAERAVDLLSRLEFKSRSVEYLLGERDISMDEVARVLNVVTQEKDLEYEQISNEEMKGLLVRGGLSEDWAESYNELSDAFSNGTIAETIQRDKTNTTSTSIEEFARTTFMDAYSHASRQEPRAESHRREAQP